MKREHSWSGAEKRGDATLEVHSAVHTHAAGEVRLTVRSYFSSHLLWTAEHEAELARKIEAVHEGQSRFSELAPGGAQYPGAHQDRPL